MIRGRRRHRVLSPASPSSRGERGHPSRSRWCCCCCCGSFGDAAATVAAQPEQRRGCLAETMHMNARTWGGGGWLHVWESVWKKMERRAAGAAPEETNRNKASCEQNVSRMFGFYSRSCIDAKGVEKCCEGRPEHYVHLCVAIAGTSWQKHEGFLPG